jgi:hypothetical protein
VPVSQWAPPKASGRGSYPIGHPEMFPWLDRSLPGRLGRFIRMRTVSRWMPSLLVRVSTPFACEETA